jgi:hypothetical protein
MKRLLSDPQQRIALQDFVRGETERVVAATSDSRMPCSGSGAPDLVRERMAQYESIVSVLRDMMIVGCYWGGSEQRAHWVNAIERFSNREQIGGTTVLIELRQYPAIIALYAGCIAALAHRDYSTLRSLLFEPKLRIDSGQWNRPYQRLYPQALLDQQAGKILSEDAGKSVTPLNLHLFQLLREPFRELLPDDADYTSAFDRFEYIVALLHAADSLRHKDVAPWFPAGCFAWRDRPWRTEPLIAKEIAEEAAAKGDAWAPYVAMLFGSATEFERANKVILENLPRWAWR